MIYFLKKKLIDFLSTILLLILLNDKVLIGHGSIVRSPDYNGAGAANGLTELNSKRPSTSGGGGGGSGEIMKSTSLNLNEPSCEELRAMWQFSRRQSRASEITNEIPTYHDPFSMNVWDPYYTPTATRSLGGRRINSRYHYGATGRPVYGRVVHQPSPQQQMSMGGRYFEVPPTPIERNRPIYEDFKPFGAENLLLGNSQQQMQQSAQNRRRQQKVRFGSGMASGNAITGQPNLGQHTIFGSTGTSQMSQISPQRGSFQRLKELVWTERAKELQQQRKNEELAARAAMIKDYTNGQHHKASLSSPSSASSRRPKTGLNSNKNKLLKDELSFNNNNNNNNNNNKNDMQLVSHSSYWPENVKRSQLENGNNNIFSSTGDESEFNLKDYSLGALPYDNSNSNNNNNDDEVMYDDDYDVNGFLDSVNQDNINDFYFYINHLLSKKPNQKTI